MHPKIDNIFDLPVPAHTRSWFDPAKTREWVFDNAVESFKKALNRIETNEFKLEASNFQLDRPERPFSFKQQKQAVLNKTDLTVPLRATVKMISKKTGAVVDEKKTVIAHIPYVTERNTTIINGSEYVTSAQQRLKPGVYTRIKESGEAEAHVNVLPGSGMGGKIIFYPDRALFVYMVGTTQIKLYGLLKELGVSDSQLEAAWGKEILLKNKQLHDGNEVDKLYSKIFSHEVDPVVAAAVQAG